jgi:DNA-binding IclR family transcriptional regulator
MDVSEKVTCKQKLLLVLEHLHSPATVIKISEIMHELGHDYPKELIHACLRDFVESGIVRRTRSSGLILYELETRK